MKSDDNFDRILEMNAEAERRKERFKNLRIRPRMSCQEFIQRASLKHSQKYDYTNVNYVNMRTKVTIKCPKHGVFQQTPLCHLRGTGCPMCKIEASKKDIYGVAINDLLYCCDSKPYKVWKSMIGRCFDKNVKNRHKSYKECDCCRDWLLFSNFKRWYDAQPHAYEDGYELDKDIFSEDKGFYSPQTCCLIPERLNIILVYRTASKNGLPRGIAKPANRYSVRTPSFIGDPSYKWMGTYDTFEEAMMVRDNVRMRQAVDFAMECFKDSKIDKRIFIGVLAKLKNIYPHGKESVAYADALIKELNKKKDGKSSNN